MGFYGWRPYVPAYARRRRAERELARFRKNGRTVSPVVIEGRTIAHTFWGKAWCDNLERYSDFENRLPRGRTYVRNGSVIDLQIAAGTVKAFVSGSEIYEVAVSVAPVPKQRWSSICEDCAGAIDSLVELLRGRFSTGVMERICREKTGLFPAPAELKFSCSCPDWASMCKHVAAVFYGIGARLDRQPELLFKLRKLDEKDLLAKAGQGLALAGKGPAAHKVLASSGLSEIFGLDMADGVSESAETAAPAARRKRTTVKKAKPAPAKAQKSPKTPRHGSKSKDRHATAKKSRAANA